MERLAPPLELMQTEAVDGGGIVHQQVGLLLNGEAADEVVDAGLAGEGGVAEGLGCGGEGCDDFAT